MKRIEVAVGVILREGQVFISKRADDLHQGGKWEFPGGKREQDESIEQALARELKEEIGIEINGSSPLVTITHDYTDKQVTLDVHTVEDFTGQPTQLEGQEARWVSIQDLADYQFPEANKVIVEKLMKR